MKQWREPFCPVCRRNMAIRTIYRSPQKPYMGIERQDNLWAKAQAYTGEIHFGVVKSSEGKGTLKMERYYEIDEDSEGYFPLIKDRILTTLKEWLDRGWLTPEEIERAIEK